MQLSRCWPTYRGLGVPPARAHFGTRGYYAHRFAVDPRQLPRNTAFAAYAAPPVAPSRHVSNGAPVGAGLAVPRTGVVLHDRLIPTGRAPVAGTAFDFQAERPIGDARLDTCFTDLRADGDGRVRVALSHPAGAPRLTIALDVAYRFVQAYTGDSLPEEAARRRGIAVEPMTCAPNAFNSGDGLQVLGPGEAFTAVWTASVT